MMHDLLIQLKLQDKADYIGESVSQLAHALQSADCARLAGAREPLVLAALLHDVGHWCSQSNENVSGLGVMDHDRIGAEYIRSIGLSDEVAKLVGLHVEAKRYLAYKDSKYVVKLSSASRETLRMQGGPMNSAEAKMFEKNPLYREALILRAWDEAAKDTEAVSSPVESYQAMIRRNHSQPLSDSDVAVWRDSGILHIKSWYDPREMSVISSSVDKMETWKEVPDRWMKYFEYSGEKKMLCRIENFLDYEPLLAEILEGSSTKALLRQLTGEEVCLFKEKINFKKAGARGFVAHQDAPAFDLFGLKFHVTMMLSIDETNMCNGCLEFAKVKNSNELLPMKSDLTLSDRVIPESDWVPLETNAGDLVVFGSYLPHRSGINSTNHSGRALYATYNRFLDGKWREQYFSKKREEFPPEIERRKDANYGPGIFNLGNPIGAESKGLR